MDRAFPWWGRSLQGLPFSRAWLAWHTLLRGQAARPVRGASPGLPSTARLFQPPQARPRSGGGGPIAALGLVACFFVWGAPLRLSFCRGERKEHIH